MSAPIAKTKSSCSVYSFADTDFKKSESLRSRLFLTCVTLTVKDVEDDGLKRSDALCLPRSIG